MCVGAYIISILIRTIGKYITWGKYVLYNKLLILLTYYIQNYRGRYKMSLFSCIPFSSILQINSKSNFTKIIATKTAFRGRNSYSLLF